MILYPCHWPHGFCSKMEIFIKFISPLKNCKEVNSTFDSFENFIAVRCGYGLLCVDTGKKVWIDLYLNL